MINMDKKLVLFDRDGVLNEAGRITRPEELRLLSNALRDVLSYPNVETAVNHWLKEAA